MITAPVILLPFLPNIESFLPRRVDRSTLDGDCTALF